MNTKRVDDEQILSAIREYHDRHGYAPSVRELAATVGLAPGATHARLDWLELEGKVMRDRRVARSLRLTKQDDQHEFHGGAAGSFAAEGCAKCPPDAP